MSDDRVFSPELWKGTLYGGRWAGGFLLFAMFPGLDATYYVFLRWIIFAIAVFWIAFGIKFPRNLALATGIMAAVLWNPVFPVYLDRGIWFVLDLAFALLFIFGAGTNEPSRDRDSPDRRSSWE